MSGSEVTFPRLSGYVLIKAINFDGGFLAMISYTNIAFTPGYRHLELYPASR
jgi:hypothetical protein